MVKTTFDGHGRSTEKRLASQPHGIFLNAFGQPAGGGSAKRFSAIKWTVVERMVWAWVLTIPATGALGHVLVRLTRALGWGN